MKPLHSTRMKARIAITSSGMGLLLTILWSSAAVCKEQPAGVFGATAGPFQVETIRYEWVDQSRNRPVPVRIYYPKSGDGPFPVIIFSHGLGRTCEQYVYLGRHWASHGYVSVHPQHKGSDANVWRRTIFKARDLRRAAQNPKNALDRPPDISFVIDQMDEINREETPLQGRLDLARVGVAGHSFGGFATLGVAGRVFVGRDGKKYTFADERVKAGIIMSCSAPLKRERREDSFAGITIPCLHMTGTEDTSALGLTTKQDRRVPYDGMDGADQYLITFQGGDSGIFDDHKRVYGSGAKDPLFHDLIRASSTAFWQAYLANDVRAKAWMTGDGFPLLLGQNGKVERKLR